MKKLLLIVTMTAAFASISAAQSKPKSKSTPAKPSQKLNVVKEGSGIEGIQVGKSNARDVMKKFGARPRREVNKKYSNQLTYDRLGLSFYYCQSDKKETIFLIEIKAPYKAKTSKGVVLGQSTKEETEKIYGKPRDGFEYKGINFYYNRYGRRNLISEIDVLESKGLRQCDAK